MQSRVPAPKDVTCDCIAAHRVVVTVLSAGLRSASGNFLQGAELGSTVLRAAVCRIVKAIAVLGSGLSTQCHLLRAIERRAVSNVMLGVLCRFMVSYQFLLGSTRCKDLVANH
jgi:hypothetical protein